MARNKYKRRYSRKSLEEEKALAKKEADRIRRKIEQINNNSTNHISDEESARQAQALNDLRPLKSHKVSTYKRKIKHK